MTTPEQRARLRIDELRAAAGWSLQDVKQTDLHAARGVAIREFEPNPGFGMADYLLYVDGRAAGVIEAKKEGATLAGVEIQSAKYAQGLPPGLPAWRRPLVFLYESTGVETHFINGLDPELRARSVFAFHRPKSLAGLLDDSPGKRPPGRDSVRWERRPRREFWGRRRGPFPLRSRHLPSPRTTTSRSTTPTSPRGSPRSPRSEANSPHSEVESHHFRRDPAPSDLPGQVGAPDRNLAAANGECRRGGLGFLISRNKKSDYSALIK